MSGFYFAMRNDSRGPHLASKCIVYRSAEFRASAAKCLRRAANATDPNVRSSYLTIAKGWLCLANVSWNARQLEEAILQEIIDPQTVKGGGTAPNGQQQQQSQPKREDSRAPARQSKVLHEVWMCGTEGGDCHG